MARTPPAAAADDIVPGLAARRVAVAALDAVLSHARPLDEALEAALGAETLDARDRGFAHALSHAAMRRYGEFATLIGDKLERGMPPSAGALEAILVTALAQIVDLETPAHAAVDGAVRLARNDPAAARYAGLVNAVLRNILREPKPAPHPEANLPHWLGERWSRVYGAATARAMAAAQAAEPPLDLTPKAEPGTWADRLGGTLLPTGTIRVRAPHGAVTEMPGFAEGAWWVQDAGALLPVLALGDVAEKAVLDLCAAPGGKTAALAARGAHVTAVDSSPERMLRLNDNLRRLGLSAETKLADIRGLTPSPSFDAVLLDAPCTATGTLRRHPDVAWNRKPRDVATLGALQADLLDAAAAFVKPSGMLVYATCSLEPEEGEAQADAFRKRHAGFSLAPIKPAEIGGFAEALTPAGTIRTRPDMLSPQGGIDGFFVARWVRGR